MYMWVTFVTFGNLKFSSKKGYINASFSCRCLPKIKGSGKEMEGTINILVLLLHNIEIYA